MAIQSEEGLREARRQQLHDHLAWQAGIQATVDAAGPMIPATISDRQFAQGLAMRGFITEDEAEQWVGPGEVPQVLYSFIEQLPADQQFGARMLLRGATVFERAHPVTVALSTAQGWTPEETDQFWVFCAAL